MTHSKVGQINWHDLFTSNRDSSMEFYGHVANWTYQVERATDFGWGCGKKNFILTLSGDEAGARLAETPSSQENGWIAYVEVPDVDVVVKRVDRLGGKIIRKPFEVPGVGRNALILDLLATLFELSLSRHSFPVPRRAAYEKFRNPASRYAICGVMVAELSDGAVRVAVTGAGADGVFRVREMEVTLSGNFDPDAVRQSVVDPGDILADMHGSSQYRAHLIPVLAARAVAKADGA